MNAQATANHLATALLEQARTRQLEIWKEFAPRQARVKAWSGEDLLRIYRGVRGELGDEFCGFSPAPCSEQTAPFAMELGALSETLGDALRRIIRLYNMSSDGLQFAMSEAGSRAVISILPKDERLDPNGFLLIWYANYLHKVSQWLIGRELPISQLRLRNAAAAPLQEWRAIFGYECEVVEGCGAISFSAAFLTRKVIRSYRDYVNLAESTRCDLVDSLQAEKTWASTLRAALAGRLAHLMPLPTLEELADEFGICSQTLRRRLKSENVSYRQLKADVRRELACEKLSGGEQSLDQIAMAAGFAETNSLVRAMRTWTGLTPSEYRAKLRHQPQRYRELVQ
jgi:AraC-like DNA-binding protein